VLARNQQMSHVEIGAHITASSIPAVDLPAVVDRMQGMGAGVMSAIDAEVSRQAMMIAFLDSFHIIAFVLLVFAPLPLLLRRPKEAEAEPPMHIE
jgi:DHA2 family multidrug resistance protein